VIERATATALIFAAVGVLALTVLLVFEQSSDPHHEVRICSWTPRSRSSRRWGPWD
jgi:hypothetical protein